MSNFDFVAQTLPQELHQEAVQAENYLALDPRTACFYSRRAAEHLVEHLYDVLGLDEPYRPDLKAHISEQAFVQVVGPTIQTKLDLIRTEGNRLFPDEGVGDAAAVVGGRGASVPG